MGHKPRQDVIEKISRALLDVLINVDLVLVSEPDSKIVYNLCTNNC